MEGNFDCAIYLNCKLVISSPEHNMLMLSYCDGPVSVVMECASSTISLNTS